MSENSSLEACAGSCLQSNECTAWDVTLAGHTLACRILHIPFVFVAELVMSLDSTSHVLSGVMARPICMCGQPIGHVTLAKCPTRATSLGASPALEAPMDKMPLELRVKFVLTERHLGLAPDPSTSVSRSFVQKARLAWTRMVSVIAVPPANAKALNVSITRSLAHA